MEARDEPLAQDPTIRYSLHLVSTPISSFLHHAFPLLPSALEPTCLFPPRIKSGAHRQDSLRMTVQMSGTPERRPSSATILDGYEDNGYTHSSSARPNQVANTDNRRVSSCSNDKSVHSRQHDPSSPRTSSFEVSTFSLPMRDMADSALSTSSNQSQVPNKARSKASQHDPHGTKQQRGRSTAALESVDLASPSPSRALSPGGLTVFGATGGCDTEPHMSKRSRRPSTSDIYPNPSERVGHSEDKTSLTEALSDTL